MSSRSDHGSRLSLLPGFTRQRKPRPLTSLPEGLQHYELKRVFEPAPEMPVLWQHSVVYDEHYLPLRAESSPPPFDPIDLTQVMGKSGPIEIEIGTGKGAFLTSYAQKYPELPLMGIEWTKPIAWYTATRLQQVPGIPYAKLLWADAPFFLRDKMPAACCQAFHIYFPDPWPKGRARKRRVMQPGLLEQLRRLALPGCKLFWGTDHQEYHETVQELLAKTPGFTLVNPNAEPTDGIMTSFERKYRQEGRDIYRSVWEIAPSV